MSSHSDEVKKAQQQEAYLKKIAHQQRAEKKEQLEIQGILSEHQPTGVNLISPKELQEGHGIDKKKALRLGIEGKLRFFAFIKYATIAFDDVIEADEDGKELFDPQYCLDVDKGFYFQVAPATLEEMLQSHEEKNEGQVQLIFPDALKGKTGGWEPDAPGVKYRTRIESNFNLWPELSERLKVSEDEHLDEQRVREIEHLRILKEDVATYQKELTKVNQSPKNTLTTTSQAYRNDNFVTLKSVVESTGKPYQDILCLARDNHESLRLLVMVNYSDLVRSTPNHEYTDECSYFALPWVCFNSILKNDRIKIDRVIPLQGGDHIGVGQLDVGLQRQDRDAVGAISVLGNPDIYEFPRDLGKFYFFKDQADQFFSIETTQPTADQGKTVMGQDADAQSFDALKALPLAMEPVRLKKLCGIFGYGPNSSTGVKKKLEEYNKRFPERPIDFHQGKGGGICLYQYEAWYVVSKVGESSGRRKPRKSSTNKP